MSEIETPQLQANQIALLTRVPPNGPPIGYSYILFDRLGNHPDFLRVPVTQDNSPWARRAILTHPGGMLCERPKLLHLQGKLPFAMMLDEFIKSPTKPNGRRADYWTDVFEMEQPIDEGRRWLNQCYLPLAEQKGCHIVTSNVIRRAMEELGADPATIHVINVDIAPDFLKVETTSDPEKRREFYGGAGEDDYIVVYHARFNSFKGQHLLLELAQIIDGMQTSIEEGHKAKIVFAIIGDYDNEYGKKLFEEAKESGYLSADKPVRLHFSGVKENGQLPHILAQADAFVHLAYDPPIISEHWGKNAVEAFVLGLNLFTWSADGDSIQKEGKNTFGYFYPYQRVPSQELLTQVANDIIASASAPAEKRAQARQARTELARKSVIQKDAAEQIKDILING